MNNEVNVPEGVKEKLRELSYQGRVNWHQAVDVLREIEPFVRSQERQRVKEALKEQAAEYRREANGNPDAEKLITAAQVVECVTDIVFGSDSTVELAV